MWALQSLTNATQLYYLRAGRDYTIGRRGTDILIGGDQSVSRVHALVTVEDGSVWVTDKRSKFGTRVGGVKVESGGKVELGQGVTFTVGQGTSTFRLVKETLTFCCSNMDSASKQRVNTAAAKLGGTLVGNWSTTCTHLVMSSVTVTVKVVCALTNARPIVTMNWLDDACTCYSEQRVLPLCDSYTPVVTDNNLIGHCSPGSGVSLLPSINRRTLFMDTTVVFLTQSQCSRLRMCVKSAGGTVRLCTDGKEEVCGEGVVVISPDRLEDWMTGITNQLDRSGQRLIPESEIGYAVLHCSKEKFCNPSVAVAYSQSVASTHLVAPSLSQQQDPLPTTSSASIPHTQTQTDVSILAYNTEGTPGGGGAKRCGPKEKVDETIIMKQRMDALFSMDSQPPAAADSSHVRQDTSMTQQDVLGRGDTQQEVRQDTAMTQQETTQVDNDSMIEDSQPTAAAVPASPQQPTSVLPHLRSITTSMLVPSSLNATPSSPLPPTGIISSAFRTKRVRDGDTLPPHSKRTKPSQLPEPSTQPPEESQSQPPEESRTQPPQPCTQPPEPCTQPPEPCTQPPEPCTQPPEPCTQPPDQPHTQISSSPFLYSSSPFLSARKKRQSQQPDHTSTPFTQVVAMDTTQHSLPADTENPLPDCTPGDHTPSHNVLSIFSNMRSRRMSQPEPRPLKPYSVATQQVEKGPDNIDFDDDDGQERVTVVREEEEEEQQPPRAQYEPVLTSDGFICARKRPRHKQRAAVGSGRFHQLHVLLREDQATVQQQQHCPPSSPPPVCRVVWTAIVCRPPPATTSSDHSSSSTTAAGNTKKFKKVKHAGSGCGHTRMIAGSRMTIYTGRKIFHPPVGGHRPRPQQDVSIF